MTINHFKIFDENRTNMLSQADYEALDDRAEGFQTGLARSEVMNKVLHQLSVMAAALAIAVENSGADVLDTDAESLAQSLTDAFDKFTGVLAASQGGTGRNTLPANALLTGNGTGAVKTVATASGAAYAAAAGGELTFGLLPVAQGGTGAATPAAARAALGITPANIGALTQADLTAAVQNLLREGGITVIKSIQRGVLTTNSGSGTITVNAVNPAKSMLHLLGHSGTTASMHITLTNGTTISYAGGANGQTNRMSWELVEFY